LRLNDPRRLPGAMPEPLMIPRWPRGSVGSGFPECREPRISQSPSPTCLNSLNQDPCPANLLGAEGVQEAREQLVHQLEVGRQGGGVLPFLVERLLVEGLRVELLTGPAVDED